MDIPEVRSQMEQRGIRQVSQMGNSRRKDALALCGVCLENHVTADFYRAPDAWPRSLEPALLIEPYGAIAMVLEPLLIHEEASEAS